MLLANKNKITRDEQIRIAALQSAVALLQKVTIYNFKQEIVFDIADKYAHYIREGKIPQTSLTE